MRMASPTSACSSACSRMTAAPTSPSTPSTCWSTRARTSPSCPTSSARSGLPALLKASRGADPLWRPHRRQGRGLVRRHLRGRRRGDHRQEGVGFLPRRARQELAQGQMHRAAGIRHRRLAGKRQAPRLPLAPPRGAGRQETDLRRQGRHRFRHADDRRPVRDDEAAVGQQRRRSTCPRRRCADRTWIEPKLVAEVAFTEFTSAGTLRHPSFIALREDKKASEVVREVPRNAATEGGAPPFGDQDQQSRSPDLPRGQADQGRSRGLLCRDRRRCS